MQSIYHLAAIFLIATNIPPQLLAQNLVPNGDFENYSKLPDNLGQWYNCYTWTNVNGLGQVGTSPDYFHNDGHGYADMPNSLFAEVEPYSGNAVMGTIPWGNFNIRNYREYITTRLNTPMEKGKYYRVSLAVTSGSENWQYGYSVNQLGLCFSTEKLEQMFQRGIDRKAQIELKPYFWSSKWEHFSYIMYADSAYEHLTIGSFGSDAELKKVSKVVGSEGMYCFWDKIEIEEIEEEELVMPNAFTPNGDGDNDVFRPIGMREDELISFQIYNRWGQELYNSNTDNKAAWNGSYRGVKQPTEVYIYVLKYKAAVNLNEIIVRGKFTLLE